ncbi:dephospho-CoA kinase [Vibrio genomosp. F10 str. ZF-129]|uniref:Dephospho-CoA kinase n=1 Tax=Vibrio genomosp. F10 str. ZF-129 TaxID=1187848 RepID=A0A1E5BJI5_9VIBR|nr:dephospho-CoA kinase [Vibrio genomosp. F10]OEE37795.1 dephospho-CoA kinase [Vibrio genomosp. F10 str. ZF-129]
MAYVVGITGGIASGKTTVADLFHQHFDVDIVDADIIAREVVRPGSEGLHAIIAHFGPDIVNSNGELNRSQLRTKIFSQPNEKQWLDDQLHPLIRKKMEKAVNAANSPYVLLVVPLLVENSLQYMTDRILVIDAEEHTQIERTMKRDGVSREQAQSILSAQSSREKRLSFADDVIKNDAENKKIMLQITELHQKYLAISTQNRENNKETHEGDSNDHP